MRGARHYVVPVMQWPIPRPDRLSAGLRVCLSAVRRRIFSAWWREIILIGILYGAYEFGRGAGDIDVQSALTNGRDILRLEKLWHLDPERLLNHALTHMTFLAVVASYFYSAMHYLVTPAVLIWMYRSHRESYGFARTALAISTAIGLVGYVLLPTAPPRMVRNSGLHDILAMTQAWGWWGDEGSVPRGWGSLTNQFAAMPSLHVGWALWCGVLIFLHAKHRWVRLLGASYPVLTTIVVMATGNHYLLDAIAGGLTVAVGALLTTALPDRFVTLPARKQKPSVQPTAIVHPATPVPATPLRLRPADERRPSPRSLADEYCRVDR
jgi:PAP2 superfamily